jgi:hypothetical protein
MVEWYGEIVQKEKLTRTSTCDTTVTILTIMRICFHSPLGELLIPSHIS